MNRFIEHQMFSTFKEFQDDYHRHFKKYSDPKEAHANRPHLLVERDENWHYLCDHYMSRAFQNQMLELQSQPTLEGTQPLSRDEIYEMMLGRRSGYSKCLDWGPKPKAYRTTNASSATTSCSQSMVELQLWTALNEAMLQIEEQTRNYDALASKVERIRKLIEDISREQQGPPHNP
ncbi:CACTA en-spm transposon protein [Cucumis melo var. makuwa]|uniref:CACTA en-spm transposon protein n=1 Tax=Cucumis melo var. makuwa TaxID=1194695 RepID=A0A5D3CTG4_CUCMM|nr:CACTA en-spm transposon protein [Cucumis melo var. makuwa]TYK15217.1 CACTA en-spm transposon protein [Cucumis melo var. makuwa]